MLSAFTHLPINFIHQKKGEILPEFTVKWFMEQSPVSFLVIATQTKIIPAVLCPSSLLEAPFSLLSYSRSSRSKNFVFLPQNCVLVHINRGLHIARSLCSRSLILITCRHMTAFLSNHAGHMMQFSVSFSINTKFMSVRGEWMTPDLSQGKAVWR